MSQLSPHAVSTRFLGTALLAVGITFLLAACTSTEPDAAANSTTSQVSSQVSSDDEANDGENISIADGEPTSQTAVEGEPSGGFEIMLTEDEGISEAPAEEPFIADSETVEVEFEETAEANQAKVGVSESALCATLQIGRDAAADGDADLADEQRDLIIERTPRLEDSELATILSAVDADRPLDLSIAEDGLRRCQTLGFEI